MLNATRACLISLNRSTITVKHENGEITGVGDSAVRKSAENLAALSALYQLDAMGVVCTLRIQLTGCLRVYWGEAGQEEGRACARGDNVVGWYCGHV